jgi:glycosyltransferase involved in cell wall biosynthesis
LRDVVFLSSDNINAQTGAAKFARLLISKPERWKNQGLNLHSISNSSSFLNEEVYRKSIKFQIKQLIKNILGKTRTGKKVRFFSYQINRLGKTPIEKIGLYTHKDTCFILNDFRVAWNFYKKYSGKYRTIFIMHNSGDMLSMLKTEMQEKEIRSFLRECEKTILRSADILIFVSEIAQKNFISLHPEYENKTRTIYIGMEKGCRCVRAQSEVIKFVTVGSVCKRKNQILAIKAIEQLKEANIQLTVVGGGPELARCQEYVMNHSLDSKVKFTGATNEVDEVLRQNDIFIMTSKDEGLPVAAQEAMAAGLPLILTDVGGCRELISGNGFVIRPVLEDVIQSMIFFIEQPCRISEYGDKSFKLYHSRFALENMIDGYIKAVKAIS